MKSTTPLSATANKRWIIFALLSAAGFALMAACVRLLSEELPQAEVVFFRNFVALLILLPLLARQKLSLRTQHFPLHLLRAGSGLLAMYLYFYALNHLPLANALLLNYTSPIFIALFAVLWLKESWTMPRRIALGLSLFGIALLFHPSSDLFSWAGLFGLASGACAGLALTTVKKLSPTDNPVSIVVWFALISSLLSAIPLFWVFQWPEGNTWAWLLAMGLCGSIGQLALTQAYTYAPVTQVSPLGYTSLLFAGIIAYFAWQEVPDLISIIGMIFIATAGITVARERPTPAPQPPSGTPVYTPQEDKPRCSTSR